MRRWTYSTHGDNDKYVYIFVGKAKRKRTPKQKTTGTNKPERGNKQRNNNRITPAGNLRVE
jgi:hypothetical protein